MIFFPFFVFLPVSDSPERKTQSFSVTSIITGSEVLVTKTAPEDRRIADYRKSPLSRLLVLND